MPLGSANVHRTSGRLRQCDHAKTGVFTLAGRSAPFGASIA
jgi:hypothetical protein